MMPGGRPTKFTPEVQKKIIDALGAGNYFEVACEYAGISVSLGMEWLQRGRGEHPTKPRTPQFAEFLEAVMRAQAEDEVHTIARLKKAGQGGDVIEETTYQEPSVIVTKANGDIEERIGKKRTVRRYSQPEPQADEWRMERKHTQRWGRKDRVDLHHFIGEEVARLAQDHGLTDEEREALLKDIEAYANGRP
jgi:hypothetical protein